MAIFHLTAKVFSRGKAQSAIAAAAYRSGERLRDEQADEQKCYLARAQRIAFTDIMAPKDAPEWAHDRNALWNQAERAEKRIDAQLAREIEVALPHEMTDQQRQWLVKDFAREAFVRNGYVVDIAIHAPDKDSDLRNHHAHIMIAMRRIGPDGFAATKDPAMNSRAQLAAWREQFAHLTNRHLERHGLEARVDHRSLKEQGIEREPTVHVGYAGIEIDARGGDSDRMNALKDIITRNDIRVELTKLEQELRPLVAIQAEHAKADQEAQREAALKALATAAQADQRMLQEPVARAYGDGARAAAAEVRQEQRDEKSLADQAAPGFAKATPDTWRESVADRNPDRARPVEQALTVVDGVTGAVSKLGDFVLDLLAGPTPQPEKAAKPSMKEFLSNPAARAAHQRAGVAAAREASAGDLALWRIGKDMENNRSLRMEDIRSLTREHQEAIRLRGDDMVRQLVDEAQKKRDYGRERE